MMLDFMNMKPCNYRVLKLTGRDAARDSHQVRPESLKICQPSYASKMPRENAQIHKWCTNTSHFFPPTKYNILLPPTGGQLIPIPHPQRAYGRTEYTDVITTFSRMGR